MSYDINDYTDEQCFELLDLNNPSDRELEMKIIQQMDKYENKSKRLYNFFEQMYDRFFDEEEDEEEEEEDEEEEKYKNKNGALIEGFDVSNNNTDNKVKPGNPAKITSGQPDNLPAEGTVNIKTVDKNDVAKATTTNTRIVDYVKDKLNPVSRKTIFKTISIDSQFRDDSQYTLSTNFSVNLSENLSNVISMKLYSVNIPYTWYTISDSFGSNYFYLKGNSPGIDNGNHDIKLQISSGTYTGTDLATAINTSISTLKTKSNNDPQYNKIYDLSFGHTRVSYNTNGKTDSKILFEFDLRKTFNETDYSLFFPNWTSPNVEGGAKSNSIPSFLGYNQNTYLPYIAYSDASANSGDVQYTLTSTSNTFSVVQYTSVNTYSENVNRVTNKMITITIDADVVDDVTKIYSRTDLVTQINDKIKSTIGLDSVNSFFTYNQIDDSSNINYGKKRAEMGIKLNRANTEQLPNSKLVVIFPDEIGLQTPPIWTGTNSCFQFPSHTIELNYIKSETQTSITNYEVGNNVRVELICVKPGYNISINNFLANIVAGNYTITPYIQAINTSFGLWRDMSTNLLTTDVYDTSLSLVNTFPSFNFNIEREFVESDYIIDLSNCIFGKGNIFQFDSSYGWANVYTATKFHNSQASYVIDDSNRTIVLIPKNNPSKGNYLASPINILLTTGVFGQPTPLASLLASINADFNSSVLRGSSVVSSSNNITLTFNASVKLTKNDYNVFFIDLNHNIENDKSWQNHFGINSSSYDLSLSNPVVGAKSIFNNLITVSSINNNNQIIIRASNTILTGGEDIVFQIGAGTYTRDELIIAINSLFAGNSITNGSSIAIANNISTIRLNVNKIYTSADFRLVFYDIYSFVYCNVGVSNTRNAKWDTTLGWTLGFHTYSEYVLSEFANLGNNIITANTFIEDYQNYSKNIYGKKIDAESAASSGDGSPPTQATYVNSKSDTDNRIAIVGDSVCNTFIYNYFLLVLDDFIQNHVGAGLITVSSVENDIALPSYASRISYQCDPITGQKVAGISTNNNFTNVSAKQLYAMNQIIESRRSPNLIISGETRRPPTIYTAGPYIRDTFAIIPLKLNSQQFGTTVSEFGGTLQNQDRKYYGPVNIKKLSVKLMSDKGDIVDLNGTNWSFTVICEILNDQT